jgi:glycosyltransferase involved in cell wall biosynthesis
MNVLIVAHGHPSIHKGGGEVAAYSMFKMLKAAGHKAVFLGWSGYAESPNGGALQKIGDDDYLLYTQSEYFHFSSVSSNLKKALEALVDNYHPDVVHFHHYIHVGIEAAAIVKQLSPKTRVIVTLHEFLAICANNGQLFNKAGEVCKGYLPDRCNKCFPEHTSSAFFMRELAIKSAFSFVDHFISPSEFLRDEYIKWGLPANKIDAIENPFPIEKSKTIRQIKSPGANQNWKIGFFGQINFYKGLDIIIDAMHKAIKNGAKVEIGIHGKMSAVTGQEYIDNLEKNIKELGVHAKFHGPYQQENVQKIMSEYHFVIMGSRWYENSPVVIQEAIAAGTPLIVPSHGGMLEKANKLSLFFAPSDIEDLQQIMCGLTSIAYDNLINKIKDYKKDAEQVNNFSKTLSIYLD